jgi:uncharacterized caspase-like protein
MGGAFTGLADDWSAAFYNPAGAAWIQGSEVYLSGAAFSPRFDRDGLIVAIATDAEDGAVLRGAPETATALARPNATRAAGTVLLRGDCSRDRGVVKGGVAGAACGGWRPVQISSTPNSLIFTMSDQGSSRRTTEQP